MSVRNIVRVWENGTINNDNVNYTIIDNVLSELINENYTFENLFETNKAAAEFNNTISL